MEVEIRGSLRKKEALSIIKRLCSDCSTLFETVIFFRQNDLDFRIKWDKEKDYFLFVYKSKIGNQRIIREEIEVKILKSELKKFLKILEILGFKEGFVSSTQRIDFENKGILWSFKFGAIIGDYWEAEASDKLKKNFKKQNEILAYLKKEANSLGLKFWSEDEFKRLRKEKWAKIRPVPIKRLTKILLNEET